MEFPELKLVRKGLKEFGLDPTLALAVLMKSLGENHLATSNAAHAAEPFEITVFEAVLRVLERESRRSGESACRGPNRDLPLAELQGHERFTAELCSAQDDLREIVAVCLDYLDHFDDSEDISLREEDDDAPPTVRLAG